MSVAAPAALSTALLSQEPSAENNGKDHGSGPAWCCSRSEPTPTARAYSGDPVKEEDPAGETLLVVTCFFLLGAASDITFNGIVLSVAYLIEELGSDVLVVVGRAQFVGSLCTMLLLFAMALRKPGSVVQSLHSQCRSLMTAMVYMLGLNIMLVATVVSGWPLRRAAVQAALLANGAATGASQSLAAWLSGFMTKFGGQATAASAQVSGVGFGVALPTAVQLLLVPLGVSARTAAGTSYSLAAGLTACGMLALPRLQRSQAFRRCEHFSTEENAGPRQKALMQHFQERFGWWIMRRFQQLALPSLGLLVNFALMVYCNLLSPHVPAHGLLPAPEALPTLLLGTTNAFDFAGRLLALRLFHMPKAGGVCWTLGSLLHGCLQRLVFIALWLAARLALAGACLAYCAHGLLERMTTSNALVVGLYAGAALCGGVATVAFTQYAQSVCMRSSGPNMDEIAADAVPCPMAGQVMLLACISGSVIGAVIPFP